MKLYEDCIIEKQVAGCPWALFRRSGKGLNFFITRADMLSCSISLLLFDVSRNYFKCRSLAIRIYEAFVSGLPDGKF